MPNYQWNDYFIRDFVVDEDQQEHLWESYQNCIENKKFSWAAVTGPRKYSKDRFCDNAPLHYKQDPRLFDVSCGLKDLADELCEDLPEDLWFAQYEFVKYEGEGQTFHPHRDDNIAGTDHNRLLTSVTMIERTDDMEGGHLYIWPTTDAEELNTAPRYTVDLEPWETVIFPAYFMHEASPVLQGRRTILISWAQYGA
jgi:hypothetical protein